MMSGTRAGAVAAVRRESASRPLDLNERLNAEIRAAIAEIDPSPGPLRARVASAAEKIVRILIPRSDTSGRRGHEIEQRSYLISFSKVLPATAHDAQASVLAEFTRSLLETDFRRGMADDRARPFNYLVSCVANRAIELWRVERALERRHESAAGDAALAPDPATCALPDAGADHEELAERLAEVAQRVPAALQMLDHDELLLLVLSAVLHLPRERIGEVLGTTSNTVGQRLSRLRDRLHVLVHDGAARAPNPRRSRSAKASAGKRAASRRMRRVDPDRDDLGDSAGGDASSSGDEDSTRGRGKHD